VSEFQLPRNERGEVLPHNHPELSADRRVIRRISSDYVVPDHNTGINRLSSALFKNDPRNGYLSVDSEVCITALGQDPAAYVTTPRWFGALIIAVGELRSIDTATEDGDKWKVGMVPLDENKCHGAVWGKITKGQSNKLQEKSVWLVPIGGVAKLESDPGKS
jgi:hypothetical protein